MRPVNKWPVGYTTANGGVILASYNPHQLANTPLQENLDSFCSYCEIFSHDLEVEHVISQHQNNRLSTSWVNFLLSCGRCNGRDNKSNKLVNLNTVYFPHLNNTYYIFIYGEGGYIGINPILTPQQSAKAQALLDLVCIDKYNGNPRYGRILHTDKRWEHRRDAWEKAVRKLADFEQGLTSNIAIADYAYERGFFSVWFTVFNRHNTVKQALLQKFNGTSFPDCFNPNNNYQPTHRNPGHPDPI